eukprot:TRINITY_DN18451_c0_g1_i2.p1 TRINITY_DN18451_c0_g1~~TRINITY_DN18451_c0_g1_i2.p1  ORF type:complete len:344 (+),score=130.10 TRINITY_DN18451_c0_g1_i2:477-1508(+)
MLFMGSEPVSPVMGLSRGLVYPSDEEVMQGAASTSSASSVVSCDEVAPLALAGLMLGGADADEICDTNGCATPECTTPRHLDYFSAHSGTPMSAIPSTPMKRIPGRSHAIFNKGHRSPKHVAHAGTSSPFSSCSDLLLGEDIYYREECKQNPFLKGHGCPSGGVQSCRHLFAGCATLHGRFVVAGVAQRCAAPQGTSVLEVVNRLDGAEYCIIASRAEGKAAGRLATLSTASESVAQYFDAWVEQGFLFVQVERMSLTLQDVVSEAAAEAAGLSLEAVCGALEGLHAVGVSFNGSIDPSHVFVTRGGVLKFLTPYIGASAGVSPVSAACDSDFDRAFELFECL